MAVDPITTGVMQKALLLGGSNMAGMNSFFARALSVVGEGASHLFPSITHGSEWSAMKNGIGDTWRANGGKLGFGGLKQAGAAFMGMKTKLQADAASAWGAAVASNPALSSIPVGKMGAPRLNLGEYFGGATTMSKISALASGSKLGMGNPRSAAIRLGTMGALGVPMLSNMMFGEDSTLSNFTRSIRNMGASAGIGLGLGAINPLYGAAWGGVSAFNAVRGNGFSPMGLFGR